MDDRNDDRNDYTDDYYEMKKISQMAKKINNEKFQSNSRNRLMDNIKKKFTTTMIGALSAFEAEFGELWGKGLPLEELTADQMEERERWESVRSHILDNGNDQARSAVDEISHYTVTWNRYNHRFIIKSKN